jgi:hypothetical protein
MTVHLKLCFSFRLNFNPFFAAIYDIESTEDTPVAVKNKMNINFTLNLDER